MILLLNLLLPVYDPSYMWPVTPPLWFCRRLARVTQLKWGHKQEGYREGSHTKGSTRPLKMHSQKISLKFQITVIYRVTTLYMTLESLLNILERSIPKNKKWQKNPRIGFWYLTKKWKKEQSHETLKLNHESMLELLRIVCIR